MGTSGATCIHKHSLTRIFTRDAPKSLPEPSSVPYISSYLGYIPTANARICFVKTLHNFFIGTAVVLRTSLSHVRAVFTSSLGLLPILCRRCKSANVIIPFAPAASRQKSRFRCQRSFAFAISFSTRLPSANLECKFLVPVNIGRIPYRVPANAGVDLIS